ncbi:Rid family hydrolase [Actinomadura sp. 7K507]|uniref:RidA family protein n=1 Tax=Actinomadura sp. 7K507 TaxID=2530365 RepID=UPI001050034C|nr:Rid family hydrolase [Actinomadura sp. 7K507]TDC97624.1 RidA family protein [Actinomadura sp. 7K507]
MAKQPITTDRAPSPAGGYSQGIVAGGMVYTAGLGPQDPATGKIQGDTVEEQTAQVLRNLQAVLAEAGAGFEDVVKVTVHLERLDRDFKGFDTAYRSMMPEPRPVRTTVGSTLAGILVEIDVVAVLPQA